MECKRCGNSDDNYFYQGHKGIYCRKCVKFKRILLDDELKSLDYHIDKDSSDFHFEYSLTSYQEDISRRLLENLNNKYDVLLKCVCGAGKTEITVRSISEYLKRGLKVCYAIPRKEVVIELCERFKIIFPKAKVISLYGGHHKEEVGDLIVCTTHQLFRYYQTFDLLILDEVDAFPLSGNKELMTIALNSAKGNVVFSTATTNAFLTKVLNNRNYKELNLYIRPSNKPLIEPKEIYGPNIFLFIKLFILLCKEKNQYIIFISSKKECQNLYKIFKWFISCTYVYSDLEQRRKNIDDFKNKKYQFIFSTTVLERGITIKDVNVIVYNSNHSVLNEENIIQMLGRVGRSITNPYGNAYILSCKKTDEIRKAILSIKEANKIYEMSLLR